MAFLHRVRQERDLSSSAVLWLAYAVVLLLASTRSHFAILANDTFPLLFQAENLSTTDPQSFYNGFFPIGYPLILKALLFFGREHIDVTGVILNIVLTFGLVWCLVKLFAGLDLDRWWAMLAASAALFLPEMVRAVLTLRPDLIVAVFAAGAFLCYRRERFDLAGLLLGVACLFRTHALALVISMVVVTVIFHGWRPAMKCLLFSLPFVMMQGLVNLYAGEAFFASAQRFNIAKMIYGADWRQEQHNIPSLKELIWEEPGALARAYFAHLLTEWYLFVPLIAGIAIRATRELSLVALLYLLAVGFGGSPRGSLPVQAIAIFSMAGVLAHLLRGSSILASRVIPLGFTIVIFIASAIVLYRSAGRAGARVERYAVIAKQLEIRSEMDAGRVLTDDFALYFPHPNNATPHVNGGWAPLGMPVYRDRIPQFMQSDASELRDSLAAHNVQWIVLHQPSKDPRLEQTVLRASEQFLRIEDISGYAVYRVR